MQKLSAADKTSKFLSAISRILGEFITSLFVVIIVMMSFLVGISVHLESVFDSWFLAIGFQSVVLITSVHADILPSFKTESGYEVSLLAFVLSIFMCWFIFIAFGGIPFFEAKEWLDFTITLTKSFAMAAVELMFSVIFVAKWTLDKKERANENKSSFKIEL